MKDLYWVMLWKPLGLAMFIPTIGLAIHIAWRSRKDIGEFLHSAAVVCWIAANGMWMITVFWFTDAERYLAVPFFLGGLVLVGWYYLVVVPRRNGAANAV